MKTQGWSVFLNFTVYRKFFFACYTLYRILILIESNQWGIRWKACVIATTFIFSVRPTLVGR